MKPTRSDYLVGDLDPTLLAALYTCGHCTSDTEARTDDRGIVHVVVHHDDGCPVLTGALSSAPDVTRAITGAIPGTFRR